MFSIWLKDVLRICFACVFDTGWWYTYPSEKYESQMGVLFPTEWKVIKFHGSKPPTRFLWLFPKISKFPRSFLQGAGCDVDIASVPRFWWWPFPVILGCCGPHPKVHMENRLLYPLVN
jgi:hypothetical protein